MISSDQIETALRFPAPGQEHVFLDFEWFVPIQNGERLITQNSELFTTDLIFTSESQVKLYVDELNRGEEFVRTNQSRVTEDGWNVIPPSYIADHQSIQFERIKGEELFKSIASRQHYNTLSINKSGYDGGNPEKNLFYAFGPDLCLALAEGKEGRPEALINRARTIDEIQVFLSTNLMNEYQHRIDYQGAELVAVYEGVTINNMKRQYSFYPVDVAYRENDLGEGVSEILCAAILATIRVKYFVWNIENNLNPVARANCHQFITPVLKIIHELQKMVDPVTNRIPPKFCRQGMHGCSFWSSPEIITAPWLDRADQICQDFLINFPSEKPR